MTPTTHPGLSYSTSAVARLSDREKLDYVMIEVRRLEEQVARATLVSQGLPSDDLDVRRLVFARELFLTMRLREHVL